MEKETASSDCLASMLRFLMRIGVSTSEDIMTCPEPGLTKDIAGKRREDDGGAGMSRPPWSMKRPELCGAHCTGNFAHSPE